MCLGQQEEKQFSRWRGKGLVQALPTPIPSLPTGVPFSSSLYQGCLHALAAFTKLSQTTSEANVQNLQRPFYLHHFYKNIL